MRLRRQLLLLGTLAAVLVACAVLLWPSPRATRATGASITSPDTTGDVGRYSSLALDATGNPVVGYFDQNNYNLKVLHCNDPYCSGGDESITSPDGCSRSTISLALDGAGNPVVSYVNGDLMVLHCNDPNCSGGDESITSPDPDANVDEWTSLALDASGNPVVSYVDRSSYVDGRLKVLHCNDPHCSGDDESITSPDTDWYNGWHNSLALDAAGNPVISYAGWGGLRIMRCNDPNCSGGDETINWPSGFAGQAPEWTSLALDASGYPVVSLYDYTSDDLRVLHCNDPDCSGEDESVTSPDTAGDVGRYTSLALDTDGYPVVSYFDNTNSGLKVLRCNDPNCSGGDESISAPDPGGDDEGYTSLALDASDNPVVGYYRKISAGEGELKLLHCADAGCGPDVDTDGDGCPDLVEGQTAAGIEVSGGLRDPKNPWDYFNPTNDGQNRIDDVLAVVEHYFVREGEPGYDGGKYDRSYVGPNDWNLGPPDGQVLVDDVLHAVKSYFHDCGEGIEKPTPTETATVTPTPT